MASGVRVQQVLLYGSHAKNTAHEDSDIDVIIVSEDFSNKNLLERLQVLGWARRDVPEPVQAYGFTPAEIRDRTVSAFWDEILDTQAVAITAEVLS
jgi:predicted nucleotidyltransferase